MKEEKAGHSNEELKPIFDLKFATDILFFKNFERSFELPPGLNFTHMKTLLTLKFHGSCSMSALSNTMLLEKGSFSPVAGKLIDSGYLRKEQSVEDKRVYNLVLTDSGVKLTNRFLNAVNSKLKIKMGLD